MPDPQKVSVLIIDDEPLARQIIIRFLQAFNEITIVGESNDGLEAYKMIQEYKPDLIFLDIQMPRINGFELLEIIENPPLIIFSTAHDEYAIKAFELNAIDYLLKPYTRERFYNATKKALSQLAQGSFQQIPNNFPLNTINYLNRIVAKNGSNVQIIPTDSIIYLESADDYVFIYCQKGKILKQVRMKYYEEHLDPEIFFRVHRSYIINLEMVDKIELYSKDNYHLILKNGTTIPASRNGYKMLKERLKF